MKGILDGGLSAGGERVEPGRHVVVRIPDIRVWVGPWGTAGLEEVGVPGGLDLPQFDEIKRRIERLQPHVTIVWARRWRQGFRLKRKTDVSGIVGKGKCSRLDDRSRTVIG